MCHLSLLAGGLNNIVRGGVIRSRAAITIGCTDFVDMSEARRWWHRRFPFWFHADLSLIFLSHSLSAMKMIEQVPATRKDFSCEPLTLTITTHKSVTICGETENTACFFIYTRHEKGVDKSTASFGVRNPTSV